MTGNKYYLCYKRYGAKKCRGSITISPNRQIIKRVEHTCQSPNIGSGISEVEDKTLEEAYEYEEKGRRLKINGHNYNLKNESMKKNKYYVCNKMNTQKCRGSVIISPNRQIIKRVEHTCQSQNQILEEVQEFEEKGGRFKINGYYYNLQSVSIQKNKYYQCFKKNSIIKCRGSVTISPNRQIIKRVEHTCLCQDQISEVVHEYE
jgi:hypothetical protein